jgi:GMP synthase-like glutamine amidotransferase
MQQLRIHYFKHVHFEGPGNIEEWCNAHRHSLSSTKFYEDFKLPELLDIDWLIIMGGPMSVNDEEKFTWLTAEKQFIQKAIQAGKTIIGVCLGAQLLADVIGAKVYQNTHKEIGWFPIEFTPGAIKSGLFPNAIERPTVFHWHGDTFDLPKNAIHLAQSEGCKNQAFLLNKILGLQFHLEMTQQSLKKMLENGRPELMNATYIQSENEILANRSLIENNKKLLFTILDKLAE